MIDAQAGIRGRPCRKPKVIKYRVARIGMVKPRTVRYYAIEADGKKVLWYRTVPYRTIQYRGCGTGTIRYMDCTVL